MIETLEMILLERNKKNYNRYRVLKELLNFISKNNNFIIEEKKFVEIINFYFDERKEEFKANNFIDELVQFFIEILDYYEEGKFERFNFLIEKEKIPLSLKKWLRENKERILDILRYYYIDLYFEKRNNISSNDFFKITKISKNEIEKFFIPTLNFEDINIRILLKGKIFYKNGIFLKEGEYLINGYKSQLGKYKILSDDFLMIIITLKKKFIEMCNIKEIETFSQVTATLSTNKFLQLLNQDMLKKNSLFFLELVMLILKGNNLIADDILSTSELFYEEDIDMYELFNTIDKNICLPEESIKNILFEKFKVNEKKLDELIYISYKMTLKKYILKEKIKCIVTDYSKIPSINLKKLLEKYNYSNMKNFRYNLKNFYDISVKDL